MLQVNVPPATPEEAQAATQGIILDVVQPKVMTWTLSLQREIVRDTSLELRYLGTRGLELPIQARTNTQSAFAAGLAPLPTFFSPSEIPAVVTGGSRLSDFENFDFFVNPAFSTVTSFPALGSSIYQGASVDLNRRLSKGIMFRANYAWSHNIDDATNELFSSRVNPRRPYDWRNLALDRSNSTLDVRHKLALSWVWDIPKMATENSFLKTVLHGWEWTGTYLVQSGQPITVLSNNDANGDGDAAGDPGILNPNGTQLVGGADQTTTVCAGAGGATFVGTCPSTEVVGYLASNPGARYVQAGLGAFSTAGRNNFRSPGVNVWNMGMYKDTKISERFSLQFRALAQNIFNHRNFSLAQPTVLQTGVVIGTTNNALSTTYANVTSPQFLDQKQFTGGNRILELGLKLLF